MKRAEWLIALIVSTPVRLVCAEDLYSEPSVPNDEYETVSNEARQIVEDLVDRFTIVNVRVVALDRRMANQLESALESGPGPLAEYIDLPFFDYSCRLTNLIETRVGAQHLGGWWGHGACEDSTSELYIGSNLEKDYFRITVYPAGRFVFGLELVKETDYAVLYELDPDSWPPPPSHPTPAGISLLPGYEHVPVRGIDTLVGEITNEDSLTIRYDIGELAGNYATGRPNERVWLQSQDQGDRTLDIALRANQTLVVTFTRTFTRTPGGREQKSYANFYAEVQDDEDIAEMLMMVLAYSGN